MTDTLASIIDLGACPLGDGNYVFCCAANLERDGVITLSGFLFADIIDTLVADAETLKDKAYLTASTHNVYLMLQDTALGNDRIFNRQVSSSKGCITNDQVPTGSPFHALYQSEPLKAFIATIVGGEALYEYGDPLSDINVHYSAIAQTTGRRNVSICA